MAGKKIIPWLDTVRVLSAFAVIVGHYASCFDDFAHFDKLRLFFLYAGNIGVFLFFVLSGYLIPPSLDRSKSLWSFYKRKLIRVVVPFTVCYLVLGSALAMCGLFQKSIAEISPLYRAIYEGKFSIGRIVSMFPVDVNLFKFLDIPFEWFVGEWFMGVLLWMYLISPLLYKAVKRAPFVTFVATILISIATYEGTFDLMLQGRIITGWWLFPSRIPEFLFGMLLFVYRDFLERYHRKILPFAVIWFIIGLVVSIVHYSEIPAFVLRVFPIEPRSFLMTLPTSYLIFICAAWLNEKFPLALAKFNGFSDVSYITMLTQHIILYVFAAQFNLEDLHSFGLVLIFCMVTFTIVKVSEWIKKFSDPAEKAFRS